jgi:hypothetical protein
VFNRHRLVRVKKANLHHELGCDKFAIVVVLRNDETLKFVIAIETVAATENVY